MIGQYAINRHNRPLQNIAKNRYNVGMNLFKTYARATLYMITF